MGEAQDSKSYENGFIITDGRHGPERVDEKAFSFWYRTLRHDLDYENPQSFFFNYYDALRYQVELKHPEHPRIPIKPVPMPKSQFA